MLYADIYIYIASIYIYNYYTIIVEFLVYCSCFFYLLLGTSFIFSTQDLINHGWSLKDIVDEILEVPSSVMWFKQCHKPSPSHHLKMLF